MLTALKSTTRLMVFLVALLSFAAGSAFEVKQVKPSGLTNEQAKELLMFVLLHEGYKLPMRGVFVDGPLADKEGTPPHTGYYDFSLGYDTVNAGATEYLGLFSVSKVTGDIWEINKCEQFTSSRLKSIQKVIMKRTGKTFADERAERMGLGCTDD